MSSEKSPYGKGSPKPGRQGRRPAKHKDPLPTRKEIARLGKRKDGGVTT